MQCNAIQCNIIQCDAMWCNAIQYATIQCNSIEYNTRTHTMQWNAMQYNTIQCNTIRSRRGHEHWTLLQSKSSTTRWPQTLPAEPWPPTVAVMRLPALPWRLLAWRWSRRGRAPTWAGGRAHDCQVSQAGTGTGGNRYRGGIGTTLHCTTLHYTNYTTLHYTTLHYTALHYTTLH